MNKRKYKKRQSQSIRHMNAYLISKCMAQDKVIEHLRAGIDDIITISEGTMVAILGAFYATDITLSLDDIKRAVEQKKLVIEVDGDKQTLIVGDKVCDTDEVNTETTK